MFLVLDHFQNSIQTEGVETFGSTIPYQLKTMSMSVKKLVFKRVIFGWCVWTNVVFKQTLFSNKRCFRINVVFEQKTLKPFTCSCWREGSVVLAIKVVDLNPRAVWSENQSTCYHNEKGSQIRQTHQLCSTIYLNWVIVFLT